MAWVWDGPSPGEASWQGFGELMVLRWFSGSLRKARPEYPSPR